MKAIRDTYRQVVEWAGRWEYTLRSGEDLIGTLHIKNNAATRAVAESAEGSWKFRKKWFPFEKVMLYPGDSETDLAVFKIKWGQEKGSLEFPDGHVFYWLPANVWRNKCVFTDAFGENLLHFKRNSNPISVLATPKGYSTGKVEITRFGLYMAELPLLLLLGCYLMIIDSI